VAGNAAEPAVLIQAHIARASVLVIATPDTFHVRAMVETARALNPDIRCLLRTHNEQEAALLHEDTGGKVFIDEHELARSMTHYVLESLADTQPH
jgi:CPA2 family monovalent cation:H+ antiporter-2